MPPVRVDVMRCHQHMWKLFLNVVDESCLSTDLPCQVGQGATCRVWLPFAHEPRLSVTLADAKESCLRKLHCPMRSSQPVKQHSPAARRWAPRVRG